MNKKKILQIFLKLAAVTGGIAYILYADSKVINNERRKSNRYASYYELVYKWLVNKNNGKKIEEYFKKNGYNKIAIYGAGTLGELLYHDLENCNIEVKGFMDKNTSVGIDNVKTYQIEEMRENKEVDCIVVTPIFCFCDIEDELREKGIINKIVSLEEIVFEL